VKEKLFIVRDGKTEVLAVKGSDSYTAEIEDLTDAVTLGHPPRMPLADSRANTAAILALFESARTGKPVLVQAFLFHVQKSQKTP